MNTRVRDRDAPELFDDLDHDAECEPPREVVIALFDPGGTGPDYKKMQDS